MTNEFSSDLHFADMCEAVLIRAKHVGKLKNIIIPELPSGYAFFSAKDIPGEKEIKIFNYTIPVFAFDTVAFVGQPVGILIGAEKSVLVDLRKNFKVLVNIGNATETEAASQSVATAKRFLKRRTTQFRPA